MAHVRLYCPDLAESRDSITSPGVLPLSAEESHHAVAALRLRPGDDVIVFDGAGREARARVTEVRRRQAVVEVAGITEYPFDCAHRLTLAVALTKAHRHAYVIEKCTELGVAAVWPVISRRSVTKPDESAVAKWSRRAVEAAKQSGRRWVPVIERPRTFDEVLARATEFSTMVLADVSPGARAFLAILGEMPRDSSIVVLIGPEGGWSEEERRGARDAGAIPVSLSSTILRTETAAVAACAAAALLSTPTA